MRIILRSGVILLAFALAACGGGGSSSGNSSSGSTGGDASQNTALNAVAYGQGVFVGVGSNSGSTPLIETSTDGITWTARTSGDTAAASEFVTVVAGSNGFLAEDDNDTLYFSSKGTTWTNVTPAGIASQGTLAYAAISWDGAEYLVTSRVGSVGTLYESTDGSAWTAIAASGTTEAAGSITRVAGTWYGLSGAVSPGGTLLGADVLTSTDLADWTAESAPLFVSGTGPNRLLYANKQFVGVGNGGLIATSADGLNWTDDYNAGVTTADLNAVAWNGSVYVAVGNDETVLHSTDGTTWTSVDVSSLVPSGVNAPDFMSVAADPTTGTFVIAGPTPSLTAIDLVSTDGVHWSAGKP